MKHNILRSFPLLLLGLLLSFNLYAQTTDAHQAELDSTYMGLKNQLTDKKWPLEEAMYTTFGGAPPDSADQVPKNLRVLYNAWKNMNDMSKRIKDVYFDPKMKPEEKLKRLRDEKNKFDAGYSKVDFSGSGSNTKEQQGHEGGIIGRLSELERPFEQKNQASPSPQAADENPKPPEVYSSPEEWVGWLAQKYRETDHEKRTAADELKAKENEAEAMDDEEERAQEGMARAEEILHNREEALRKTSALTVEDLVKPEQKKLNREWEEERGKIKNSKLSKSEKEAKIAELAETYLKKITQLRTPEAKKKNQGILDQKKREAEADRAQAEKEVQAAQEKVKQVKAKRTAWEEAKEAAKKKISESDAKLKKISQDFDKQFAELIERGRLQRKEEQIRAAAGDEEYKDDATLKLERRQKAWKAIEALGLDRHRAATIPNTPDTPAPADPLTEGLKSAGEALLEELGGGPIPIDTIEAVRGIYEDFTQKYNPNTIAGTQHIYDYLDSKGYREPEYSQMYKEIVLLHRELGDRLKKPIDLIEAEETPRKSEENR